MRRAIPIAILACCFILHGQPKALFYLTDNPDSIRSFLCAFGEDRPACPDVVLGGWRRTGDRRGQCRFSPRRRAEAAGDARSGVGRKAKFHSLATSADAQDRMNRAMLREARRTVTPVFNSTSRISTIWIAIFSARWCADRRMRYTRRGCN